MVRLSRINVLRALAIPTTLAMTLSGCGGSSREAREAKMSGYETDFAVVYSEALAAVTERYPQLQDSPRAGVIQTSWHPVNIRQVNGNMSGVPTGSQQQQVGAQGTPFGRTGPARTFFFVRFRINVIGGRPWRIRIKGEASKWEEGSTPVPLNGADMPSWLPGRVDSLRVKIHRRLKKYAVRLQSEVVGEPKPVAKVDKVVGPELGDIPAAAAKVVAAVRDAATTHDYQALRKHMAEAFVWTTGAPPSADQALIMWQADPSLLARLIAAIDGKCSSKGQRVVCPATGAEPKAVFQKAGTDWQLIEFAAAD